MAHYQKRSTDAPFATASQIEEVRVGVKTYLSHPRLWLSEFSGAKGILSVVNIAFLREMGKQAVWMDWITFELVVNKDIPAPNKELIIVDLYGNGGQRAFVLATGQNRELLEQLDVLDIFDGASIEDALLDWEDVAWESARAELYLGLHVVIKDMLNEVTSERRQKQIMWDAYIKAKEKTRLTPKLFWNRCWIDARSIAPAFATALCRELHKERARNQCANIAMSRP